MAQTTELETGKGMEDETNATEISRPKDAGGRIWIDSSDKST